MTSLECVAAIARRGIRALPRLPGTRREVEALARLFNIGPESIALGEAATEDFVRRMNESGDLGRARIVHFATHGLLSGAFKGLGEPALALDASDTHSFNHFGWFADSLGSSRVGFERRMGDPFRL